nr:putative ribonuclease H-like domain-containing protein [Tanacetum cinerariifolium]
MRPSGCPVTIFNTIDHLEEEKKQNTKDSRNENSEVLITEEPIVNQEKDNVNNTNRVNVVSSTVNAASNEVNVVGRKSSIKLPDDPNMPEWEDISIFEDSDEDVFGAKADLNDLESTFQVSPILITRIYNDHPLQQVIGDMHLAPQTKRMSKNLEAHGLVSTVDQRTNHKDLQNCLFACFLSQMEPKKVIQALKDLSWIEAMQEELLQLSYKKLFLAYASFKDFVVYQIDVKSVFYEKIKEEVYICQPLGFEDLDFPDKVYKVEKALYGLHQAPKMMHKKFQMSFMGELTFFLRLQVKQKEDGIFISQDKYVNEILTKFGFSDVKTTSTPMETHKTLLKNDKGEDVDKHLYKSMIRSLMYLTSSRPDIMCACARFQVNPKILHFHDVKRIFRYLKGQPKLGLLYHKDSPFDLVAYTDSEYAGASLDRKSITGGCQFLGCRLISWQCKKQTVVANSTTKAEYVAASSCCGQAKNINEEARIHAKVDGKKVIISEAIIRRDLKFEDEGGIDFLSNEVIFEKLTLMGSTMASAIICLATNQKFNFSKYLFESMVKHLDTGNEFLMYPRFVQVFLDKQVDEMSKHNAIYVIPSHTKKTRFDDQEMFDTWVLNDEEVVVEKAVVVKEVNTAQDQVSAATTTIVKDLIVDDITLAKALEALKTSKPKIRGIVVRDHKEPSESTIIPTSIANSIRPKEKGIAMEEPSEATTITIPIPLKV